MKRQIAVEIQVRPDRALIPSGSVELRMEGSTWYGNVPNDWNVDRFKRIATIRNGQVDPEDDRYKDLPLFAPNHIESGTGRLLELESADAQGAESGKFLVEPGEVVYSKIRPELRKVIVAPCKGLCSADMYPVHPGYRVESRFLYYEMLSDGFSQYTVLESDRVAMPKINRKSLGECIFLYPDRKQQARICEYLDSSCAAIDAAVAAKRRQLQTLDALRKSTVHRAVTQGLNPEAKMKSAGIPWLSDVPSHWISSRIKNVAKLSPGYSGSHPANDEMCTFVPMESLSNAGTVETGSLKLFEDVSSGFTFFENGDVLFAKITPCMENGKGAFIASLPTRYAFGSTEFHVLRAGEVVDGEFLYYFTYNPIFRAYAAENMSGAAGQKRVSSRFLKETRLFLPPREEQMEIVSFIKTKDREFRALFAQIEAQIATLTAYRKSLIHECVTGQRRITEADLRRAGDAPFASSPSANQS